MPCWYPNANSRVPYTRTQPPRLQADVVLRDLLELPVEQHFRGTAVHEAAHAVLLQSLGATVEWVVVRPYTELAGDEPAGENSAVYDMYVGDLLTCLAAGERAESRWLGESGLLTPVRAYAVELLAQGDRDMAGNLVRDLLGRELTFGVAVGEAFDYQSAHDAADAALDRCWPAVIAVADALVAHRRLDGEQIAALSAHAH
ncbi:hypothetical protein [Streptomyces sasae]|uniref:hypothetical protein n=1 Tax=Streptomyces sasae TaxID=1266772 RepID=UPI00292FC881|nr:hypothetical protein [Streptomyces sasae]